jgi:hypothetical protein
MDGKRTHNWSWSAQVALLGPRILSSASQTRILYLIFPFFILSAFD